MPLITVADYQTALNQVLVAFSKVAGYSFPYRDLKEVGMSDTDIQTLRTNYASYTQSHSDRPLTPLPSSAYGDTNLQIHEANLGGRTSEGTFGSDKPLSAPVYQVGR